tara:strand:- start:203 stop:3289 length:3087 start_codon:yes stop_codon:yes gene_type:complete
MKQIISLLLILSITSLFSQDIVMQQGTFYRCAPDRFFASGGEFGTYSSNENYTLTICPEQSADFIKVNFVSFSTQLNQDILTIYDGDNTNADVLGSYSGAISPGLVTASDSNISGCLTFVFTSNDSGNTAGWEAEIICANYCQNIVASIDNTTPQADDGYNFIEVLPNESVDFFGSADFSVNGTNASYNWYFGDGNTATGTDVSNTFTTAGTYIVTLNVTGDNPEGCSNATTFKVLVLGPNIMIDQNITPEQLIQDVLVESPCTTISNVISSTGINFNPLEPNGIGYFTSDGSLFPFEDGVLLSTGDASRAEGPNDYSNDLNDGTWGWPSDIDLDEQLVLEDYLDPAVGFGAYTLEAHNATSIQFDFTPITDTISLEFLMAYEGYQLIYSDCRQVSDAVGILLTDSMGNTTNLALLPGTTTPILISNHYYVDHPGSGCFPLNDEYFDGYIGDNAAPMSFDWKSVVFNIQFTVIPGDNYTLKIVVADVESPWLDSGIFLKGKSLNLGSPIFDDVFSDDITIAQGTAECYGSSITLDTARPQETHNWYYAADPTLPEDRIEISGQTTSIINVTEPGLYFVDIWYSENCYYSDSILVEFKTTPIANTTTNLTRCITDTFDLTENDELILGNQNADNFIISYHLTEADAINNLNILPTTYTNTTNPQIIWARIADNLQECYDTISFSITTENELIINAIPDIELCDITNTSNEEEVFNLTENENLMLNGLIDVTVTYHQSANDANLGINSIANPTNYTNNSSEQEIYVRVTNNSSDCYTIVNFTIKVNPLPVLDMEDSYTLCFNDDQIITPLIIDTELSEMQYIFEWSRDGNLLPAETSPAIEPNVGGLYSVIVTNTNTDCAITSSTEVLESGPPILVVNTLNEAFATNQTIEAIATGIADNYEYSLDGGSWQDEGLFNNVTIGSHNVSARDKNGCEITTVPVFIVGYPLFFTPNGDGNNDTWKIEGLNSNATIYIFNRYNKLIKQLQPQEGWDGTLNGKELPTSDYWFTLDYIDALTGLNKTFRAHFTLKR